MADDDETDGAKHSRTSSSSSSSSGVVLSIAHLPTTEEDEDVDEVSVLRSQLDKCRKSLSEKDDEIHRLSGIRDKIEAELEDLTASLFEEAHRMVAEANVKRASAEKSVTEGKMQIDGLTAEVAALKTMVITSTPAQPHKHLRPQIDSQASPSILAQSSEEDMFNIDPIARKDFLEWIKKPSLDRSAAHDFINKLYSEDIEPALRFTHAELGTTVFHAIVDNTLTISPIARDEVVSKKCALIQAPRLCRYRVKLGSVDYDISQLSRNRIISVCDCWNYLRYVTQGLVKSHTNDIYWKVMRLRINIFMARLGFKPD